MKKGVAGTVEDYLASLPAERREAFDTVLGVVRANMPAGYREGFAHGMVVWSVPLATYPDTYNQEPLLYAALASQKRHLSLYLMGLYSFPDLAEAFERDYRATGKRYDVGKSCVRFRTVDDLPLELVARTVAAVDVSALVARAEDVRRRE